jgi:hypothetical protein
MAKTPTDIRSLARSHTAKAVRTLAGIMNEARAPAAARVSAAIALLDRGWGKPEQSLEITNKRDIREYSDAELLAIATRSSDGDLAPAKPKTAFCRVTLFFIAYLPEPKILLRPENTVGCNHGIVKRAVSQSSIVSGAQYTPVSSKSFWRAGFGGASRPLPEREQEWPRLSATRLRRPRAKWR